MTLSGELWDRFCSPRVRSRTLLTHLTTALSFSLMSPSPLTVTRWICVCVCVGVNQREVCVVNRSSIGPQVLWVKTQTDHWRAQRRAHPSTLLSPHLYVHIYGNTQTNDNNVQLTVSISFSTSRNWCVYVCACRMLHVLVGITHSVTDNQFYDRSIHKSLFVY